MAILYIGLQDRGPIIPGLLLRVNKKLMYEILIDSVNPLRFDDAAVASHRFHFYQIRENTSLLV